MTDNQQSISMPAMPTPPEESGVGMTPPEESGVGMTPPVHSEDEKPTIETVESEVASNITPLVPSTGRIEVVAMRPGFFNQHRKAEGAKFSVPSIEKCGEWMQCVDPIMEKKRVEFFIKKKKGE